MKYSKKFFLTLSLLFFLFCQLLFSNPNFRSAGALLPNSFPNSLPTYFTTVNVSAQESDFDRKQFDLFMEIRGACLASVNVFASTYTPFYKLIYSQLALNFIARRISTFTSDKVLQNNLEILRARLTSFIGSTSGTANVTENDIYLFINQFGHWYLQLRAHYFSQSELHLTRCQSKLQLNRKHLLETFDMVQSGAVCQNSSHVYHFQDFRAGLTVFNAFHLHKLYKLHKLYRLMFQPVLGAPLNECSTASPPVRSIELVIYTIFQFFQFSRSRDEQNLLIGWLFVELRPEQLLEVFRQEYKLRRVPQSHKRCLQLDEST